MIKTLLRIRKQVETILDVTQYHTFNCTKEKTSEKSITPPLKKCLFLCFQISPTTATQVRIIYGLLHSITGSFNDKRNFNHYPKQIL